MSERGWVAPRLVFSRKSTKLCFAVLFYAAFFAASLMFLVLRQTDYLCPVPFPGHHDETASKAFRRVVSFVSIFTSIYYTYSLHETPYTAGPPWSSRGLGRVRRMSPFFSQLIQGVCVVTCSLSSGGNTGK